MGTRGAVGFRINGEDKLTYNHGDSHPMGLGIKVFLDVCNATDELLQATAARVKLVDNEHTPATQADIEACAQWSDFGVGFRRASDWYCILRGAQGGLEAYLEGLPYMLDGTKFIYESLFCEWAYIVDVDTKRLEVYRGFQQELGGGRYNRAYPECDYRPSGISDHTGCKLLTSYSFDDIRRLGKDHLSTLMRLTQFLASPEGYEPEEGEPATPEEAIAALFASANTDIVSNTESVDAEDTDPQDALLDEATELLADILEATKFGFADLSDELTERLEAYLDAAL